MSHLMETFLREMECGLSRDPQQRKRTPLLMDNTYVCSLLDGKGLFAVIAVAVLTVMVLLS